MPTFICIAGIIVSLILMLYLAYKGMHTIYLAPLLIIIVCLTNGLPVVSSYTDTYMGGFTGIIAKIFPYFLMGSLLGKTYAQTGAAASIAKWILDIADKVSNTEKGKRTISIVALLVINVILGYGGINPMVLIFATYPIANSLARKTGIPRRFLPGLLSTAGAFVFCAVGSPGTANVLAGQILGTSPNSGLIPGIVGGLIIVGGGAVYFCIAVEKAVSNGEVFTEHPREKGGEDDRTLPNVMVSFIPLIFVFVTFAIMQLNVNFVLFWALVLCYVLFYKFFPTDSPISKIMAVFNPAVMQAAPIMMALAALSGFGSVVMATPAYEVISAALINLPGPPVLVAGLIVMIIVGVTSSAPAGLNIALGSFGDYFISLGVNPAALHRVAAFSTATLDSLPMAGSTIGALEICGQNHKEGYFPIFVTTVLLTTVAMVVSALLLTWFPGMA